MRTVVVGASSGLGRCIGVAFAREGDDVALLARRREQLDERRRRGWPFAHAHQLRRHRRNPMPHSHRTSGRHVGWDRCARVRDRNGHVAARGRYRRRDLGPYLCHQRDGRGPRDVCALPHLAASHGAAAVPLVGQRVVVGALARARVLRREQGRVEKLVEVWRVEHPEIGFTRMVVGDCAGGEGPAQSQFATGWDQDLAAEVMPTWIERGLLAGTLLDVDELIRVLRTILSVGASASIPCGRRDAPPRQLTFISRLSCPSVHIVLRPSTGHPSPSGAPSHRRRTRPATHLPRRAHGTRSGSCRLRRTSSDAGTASIDRRVPLRGTTRLWR